MPKLKFPASNLMQKIADRGYDIAHHSRELFAFGWESDPAPERQGDNSQPDYPDGQANPNQLQRTTPIQRTPSFSPWIGAEFFICISVKEAVDLCPSVPMRPATCDSFVRVTLQRLGALPLEEAETRVITRNCFPMWEESLPFPLDHVTEDMHIFLRVLDKDIGHFNSFLGIVSLPIKDALAAIHKIDHEKVYRLPLMDRQKEVKKKGELVFGVSVVAKQEYKEMRGFISSIQDPDTVHDSLGGYSLHIKLHRFKELSGLSNSMLAALVVEVSVCSYGVRKQLVGQLVGGELDPEAAEVVVPLGRAFRDGDTLKGKDRAQFGEVKVELLAGRSRLAKTQVPIWDVPVRSETVDVATTPGDGTADSDSDGEFERAAAERRRQLENVCTGLSDQQVATATSSAPAAPGSGTPPRPNVRQSAAGGNAGGQARTHSPEQNPSVGAGGGLRRASEPMAAGPCSDGGAGTSSPATRGGPRPLWDGKRYCRKMERLDRCLTRAPVAVISMQMVKGELDDCPANNNLAASTVGGVRPTCASVSAGGGAADAFDGVDVDSPREVLVPPPFDSMANVADYIVGVGPSALLKMVFADGSELAKRVWMLEKVGNLNIGPWVPDPDSKVILSRSLSYMKPSAVGMVAVQSQQKLLIKHDGGFVIHQYVTPNVPPIGHCVRILGQVVGQHVGPNRTRLTVDVKLEWFKSGMMVNMIKGKIEDGTPRDTRKYFETIKKELAAQVRVEEADGTVVSTGSGGAAAAGAAAAAVDVGAATAAAALAADGGITTSGGAGAAGGGLLQSPPPTLAIPVGLGLGALVLVLVLVLIGSMLQIKGELARSRGALEGLSREVGAVSRALEALAQRLPPQAVAAAATPAKR